MALKNRLSLSVALAVMFPFVSSLPSLTQALSQFLGTQTYIAQYTYMRNIVVSETWLEKPSFTASFPLNTKGLSLKSLFLGDDSLIEKKLHFDSEVLRHITTVILILPQKCI